MRRERLTRSKSWAIAAWSLCALACGGCEAGFTAGQSLTAANAESFKRIYLHRFGDYLLLERMVGAVPAIGAVAVDAEAGRLYVKRDVWPGWAFGRPVGIQLIDLPTGRTIRTVPLPAYPDLTGHDSMHRFHPTFLDVGHRRALVSSRWDVTKYEGPDRQAMIERFGTGPEDFLVSLDLEGDDHRLVSMGITIPHDPVVDAGRLLAVTENLKRWEGKRVNLMRVERSTGRILDATALPNRVGFDDLAACDQYVIILWNGPMRPGDSQIETYRWDPDGLHRMQVWDTPGQDVAAMAVDRERNRLAVVEEPTRQEGPAGDDGTECRLRILDIPSLDIVATWPLALHAPRQVKYVPGTSLVVLRHFTGAGQLGGASAVISLIDTEDGRVLVTRRLDGLGMVDTSWEINVDPSGAYVAAWSMEWVQLFSVPASQSGVSNPHDPQRPIGQNRGLN